MDHQVTAVQPAPRNKRPCSPVPKPAPVSIDSNQGVVTLTGELTSDGTFSGRVVVTGQGQPEMWLRALTSPDQDSAARNALLASYVNGIIPDVKVDSLTLFDGKNFSATPVVSYVIHNARPTQRQPNIDVLPNFDASEAFTQMANGVEAPYRSQPIDAARILPLATSATEIHVVLPEGWKARLPPSISATSPFGNFQITYRQTGRSLDITRRAIGADGIYPENRSSDVIAWLRQCAMDHSPVIVIEHEAPKTPPSAVQ
jgi:hypothetical protein